MISNRKLIHMINLTGEELNFILESLNYTKLKFENYPIGPGGYPSYEYKQKRLEEVASVVEKVRQLKKHIQS